MDRIRIARNLVRIARQFVQEDDYAQPVTNTSLQKYRRMGEAAMATAVKDCVDKSLDMLLLDISEILDTVGITFHRTIQSTYQAKFDVVLPDTHRWNTPKYMHSDEFSTLRNDDDFDDLFDGAEKRNSSSRHSQSRIADIKSPYNVAVSLALNTDNAPQDKNTVKVIFAIENHGRTRTDSDIIDLSKLMGKKMRLNYDDFKSLDEMEPRLRAMMNKIADDIVQEHKDFLQYDAENDWRIHTNPSPDIEDLIHQDIPLI